MRYKITNDTGRILNELARLAQGLQDHLPSISAEARREWEELRIRWPSECEVRQGTVVLSYDELAIMESKVRRFHDILATRSSSPPDSRRSQSAKERPQELGVRERVVEP